MNVLESRVQVPPLRPSHLLVAVAAGLCAWSASLVLPWIVSLLTLTAVGVAAFAIVRERPEVGVGGLVVLAALDVTGRIAKVGGITITAYQIGVLLLGVLTLMRVVRGDTRTRATVVDLPLALFLAFAAASVPGAADPKRALVQLVSLLSSAALVYLVAWNVRTPSSARTVVLIVLGFAAVLGVVAVAERLGVLSIGTAVKKWGYGVRATATFDDPNILGSYLACALGLGAPVVLAERRMSTRLVGWAACASVGVGLLLTFSRGAWLAAAVAMLVVVALARVPWRVKMLAVGAVGLAGVAFLVFYLDPEFVRSKLLGVTENRSALNRVYLGVSALEMFLDHPMGVGLGSFPLVFPLYRHAFVNVGLVESHTAYLTVLAEAGIVGFAGFVWLFMRCAKAVLRRALELTGTAQAIAVGALAAGSGLLVQAFTYSLETSKFLWLTVGIGMAVTHFTAEEEGDRSK